MSGNSSRPGAGEILRSAGRGGRLLPIVQFAVTAALLFLIFRMVDISKLMQDLRNLDPLHLALLAIVCWIGHLLCIERWRVLASAMAIPGTYVGFAKIYFVGMFCNIGLPSIVGGDVVKGYLLSRKTRRGLGLSLASILQDRIAGLLAMLLLGSILVPMQSLFWRGIPLAMIYALVWAGVLVVLFAAWKGEHVYGRLASSEGPALWGRILDLLARFHQALVTLRLSKLQLLLVLTYSCVNTAIYFWIFQQISVAAGHGLELIPFATLIPLITIITMLPISLGGVGIREWAYVEALALLHVPPHTALTIALITSALLIVTDLAGVFFVPTIPGHLRPRERETSP